MQVDKKTYLDKTEESKVRGEELFGFSASCVESTDDFILKASLVSIKPRSRHMFIIVGAIKQNYYLYGMNDILTYELIEQEKILNIDVREDDRVINIKFSVMKMQYSFINQSKVLLFGNGSSGNALSCISEKILERRVITKGKHIMGLPIAEGMECLISGSESKYVFEYANKEFSLSMDKITDVGIKTDIEIQKSVVSSAGSAIAGGMLFGVAGAIVGGTAREHTSKIETKFLIFSYSSNDDPKYICFQIYDYKKAQELVDKFNQIPRDTIVIDL